MGMDVIIGMKILAKRDVDVAKKTTKEISFDLAKLGRRKEH